MSRLTPTDWRTLSRVFESVGFSLKRQTASHLVYEKPGVLRPIIIPKYDEIGPDIILGNLRSAGIARAEYLAALREN